MIFNTNKKKTIIKNDLKYTIKKVTKERVETIYDGEFRPLIIDRGKYYYEHNKVINYKCNNNVIEAQVTGKNTYDVKLTLEGNKITSCSCSCPYYEENNNKCKHMYATLLKCIYTDNQDKLIKKTYEDEDYILNKSFAYMKYNQIIEEMKDTLKKLKRYSFSIIDKEHKKNFSFLLKEYKRSIKFYSQNKKDDMTPELYETVKRYLNGMKKDLPIKTYVEEEYHIPTLTKLVYFSKALQNVIEGKDDNYYREEPEDDWLFPPVKSEEEKRREQLEKEMDWYDLSEEEKEEVRMGNFDPEDFEEEGDLEEGDYYYEDWNR